jgi:hypothetical protein
MDPGARLSASVTVWPAPRSTTPPSEATGVALSALAAPLSEAAPRFRGKALELLHSACAATAIATPRPAVRIRSWRGIRYLSRSDGAWRSSSNNVYRSLSRKRSTLRTCASRAPTARSNNAQRTTGNDDSRFFWRASFFIECLNAPGVLVDRNG